MPKYDGSGPWGEGGGTGWGFGPCGAGRSYGRRGAGRGQGLGWRRFWGYYPAPVSTKKEEAGILSEEAVVLEEELKAIKARLAELKGQK